MRHVVVTLVAWGLLLSAPCPRPDAAVYGYVDGEGTAHFTDAPNKTYFRWLPAFGLPPGAILDRGQYAELINAIAAENGVDPSLVKAIIRAESNFDRRAIDDRGAGGGPRRSWHAHGAASGAGGHAGSVDHEDS